MLRRLTLTCPVEETARVQQVRGLFDLPPDAGSAHHLEVDLPLEEKPWSLGLIVGPSGCGKTTLARSLWPRASSCSSWSDWSTSASVLDAFPDSLTTPSVVGLLSAVGFSSPPAWLRPYGALSTGQQFRARLALQLARALAEKTAGGEKRGNTTNLPPTYSTTTPPPTHPCPDANANAHASDQPGLVVCDEYSSTVGRTVARVASAALARCVRSLGLALVAVTCHEDVEEWLCPDWVLRPAEGTHGFSWRLLQRRPKIPLEVFRCQSAAWPLFAPHHYLSGVLSSGAVCFLAAWAGEPVGFSAWLHQPGPGLPSKREHRTVVLPDFQGVGVGQALSGFVASLWKGLGFRAISTTTHPGFVASRRRSPLWRERSQRQATKHERGRRLRHATRRLTASFEYVGPALPRGLAAMVLGR